MKNFTSKVQAASIGLVILITTSTFLITCASANGCPDGMEHRNCSWNLSCSNITSYFVCNNIAPCTEGCFCAGKTVLINGICSNATLCSVTCSALNSPSNGTMNCSLGDDGVPSYEDTCSFTCNTGTGSVNRTCQSDGSWSGSAAMCNRVVEFASRQFVDLESSGYIEVIVRITGGSSITPIIVTVTPSVKSPVSAMGSGVDFNSDPFNITINVGATDGRANVSVTCDNVTEELETFDMTLTITSDSPGVTLGRDTCEGQIDDSTAVVSFNQSLYRVMEDDCTVNITIKLSQATSVQFEVMIGTEDITATTQREDYTGRSMSVNISAGIAMQSFAIMIIDDKIVECDETFNVIVMSVKTSCGVTIESNTISEVMIRDDDRAIVSLSQSQYSVVESDNSLTGTITLSSKASEDVIVEVTISNGSANAGVDFAMSTALVFNVNISAGSTSSSFSIGIINDVIQEDNETFNIAIRLLPNCLSLSLGTSSSTVTIIDDDVAMITFTSSTFSGLESSGVISATIAISGGIVSSKDINITIAFIEGNASAMDFNSSIQTVTIAAGFNISTMNIPVTNDDIVEGGETFTMSLSVPSSLGPEIITGTITSATVTIVDTTSIRVRFASNRYTGLEAEGFVVVTLELNGGISAYSFNVNITASEQSPLSAEGGVDFNPATRIATFASGMRISNVSIALINDSIAEGHEEFNLTLNVPASLGPAIAVGNISNATGVITDSTMLEVEFVSPQFIGSESSGLIEVIVRITGGSSIAPITVTVTPSVQSPVSAIGSGVDFNSDPFNITINAGATDGRANVSVTCDDEVEELETFNMTLTITSDSPGVILGRDTCKGQINDSTVELSFDQLLYEVSESERLVTIIISLSQVSSDQFEVEVCTMDVTATGSMDYDKLVRTITIPAGVTSQSFTMSIINNKIVEYNETFNVTMTSITNNKIVECNETFNVTMTSVTICGVTIGSNRSSEVMIRDDDGATVSLNQSQYSVVESDSSLIGAITLSSRASEDVIVEVTISNGSATAGVDYTMSTALVFNVSISAGLTSSSFSIDIINDIIQEDNETFNITIRLMPSCLSLSLGTSSSTVNIIDDDVAMIGFATSNLSGLESDGVLSVQIMILKGIVSSKNIDVNVTLVSIGDNIDFNSTTQTVTIIAGTSSTTVNITLQDDNIPELDKVFNITLAVPPSSGSIILASNLESAIAVISDTSSVAIDSIICNNPLQGQVPNQENCSPYDYQNLTKLMAEVCKAEGLNGLNELMNTLNLLTMDLVSLTNIKEDGTSACPSDLMNIVLLLEFTVNIAESYPAILSSEETIQNTIDVLGNILSPLNNPGWMELQMIDPTQSQMVLILSERFGLLLAKNLDEFVSSNLWESDNIMITTELVNASNTDDISSIGFKMQNSIVIPDDFIQQRSSITGVDIVPIAIIHYTNIQNILPVNNSASSIYNPISQVISGQVTNISDASSDLAVQLSFQYSLENMSPDVVPRCGFWNFSLNEGRGGWDTRGVKTVANDASNSIIICNSSHLTSFAVLVDVSGAHEELSAEEIKALSIISYIGCGVSLLCLIIAIIALVYYRRKIFKEIQNFIHLNLAIALSLALVVFVSGIETATENDIACKIVAGLLHYFFTAVFTWMLCEGILLYILLVKVFNVQLGQKRWLYFLLGWGIPVPIVGISAGIAYDQYGNEKFCWISTDQGAIWGFAGPMIAIIIVNFIFLVLTFHSLYKSDAHSMTTAEITLAQTIKRLLKISVILLPLLGITWIFGVLAVNQESSVFAWIFTVLNSLQGMFILLFQVLRNKKFRKKIICCKKRSKHNVSSKTDKLTVDKMKSYTTDISGLNTVSSDVLTFRNSGVEENGLSLKPIETECPVKPQVLCNSLSDINE